MNLRQLSVKFCGLDLSSQDNYYQFAEFQIFQMKYETA